MHPIKTTIVVLGILFSGCEKQTSGPLSGTWEGKYGFRNPNVTWQMEFLDNGKLKIIDLAPYPSVSSGTWVLENDTLTGTFVKNFVNTGGMRYSFKTFLNVKASSLDNGTFGLGEDQAGVGVFYMKKK